MEMWGVSSNYVQLVFNLNIDQQHLNGLEEEMI